MEAINRFFTANRALVYFIGGLAFFSMGLATLLQRRRYSRLRMARCLGLLAWFGILYGVNEWGNLLIPLQEELPLPVSVTYLTVLQLLVRALALGLLFQFGIELLRPPGRPWQRARLLSAILLLIWGGALGSLYLLTRPPGEVLFSNGDLLARYLLGLPAVTLASLGLLEQRREVRQAGFPQIGRYLLAAAVALLLFGLVGVLLGVAGPFFPGDWLGYPAVLYVIGVFVPILRTLDGAALALLIGRALEVFEAETDLLLSEMEHRTILLADRERIGRELHDGIIQRLYAAGLRLEEAHHFLDRSPQEARPLIRNVMEELNQVIDDIRAYIFDLKQVHRETNLERRLEQILHELRLNTMLEVELTVRGKRYPISEEFLAHLSQIAQEALSNVVRHAHAHRVQVELDFMGGTLGLTVQDDGIGFDPQAVLAKRAGMGLRNMCQRARILGGTLQIHSRPGEGARLELRIPCKADSGLEVAHDICTVANLDR